MWSSVYWPPPFLQRSISSCSIGREALEMSVCPWQNFSNPPPVPAVPTETLTSGDSSRKTSPAEEVSGSTVEEPSTTTSPDALVPPLDSPSLDAPLLWPPQAARPAPRTRTAGAARAGRSLRVITGCLPARGRAQIGRGHV